MLKIRKDGLEYIVTQGTYDNLYKGMGFEIVSGGAEKKATPIKEVAPTQAINEGEKIDKQIEEKIEDEKPSKFSKKESK